MEDKKGTVITIVILILIILGLGAYIFYDIKEEKKELEEKETMIKSINIDLNTFYQISDTLDSFDLAFNNPKSSYVGYMFVSKKMSATKFDMGAAIYASMIQEMDATNGSIQSVLETRVQANFQKIFGKNLSYEATEVNSGEIYKVAYNNSGTPLKYDYIAPGEFDTYAEKYISVNYKTSLTTDSVLINRKIFYVVFVPNSEGVITKAAIYKDHHKQNKLGEVLLKNGEISTTEVLSKYSSRLLTYQYTFKQESQDTYTFSSIEPVK